MRSPVPTITDDQLDDVQVMQRAHQMLAYRPDLISAHDTYSQNLDEIRRREIASLKRLASDLLCIIETGLTNPAALERARQIARDL